MNISENNFLTHFNLLNQKNLSLIDIFKQISKNINFKSYNSIQSNFIPLFIYYSVLQEKPLTEFKEVIEYIYSNENLLKNMNLHRFFKESSNMSWKGYFYPEANSYINIYDDMSFLFFNINSKKHSILHKHRFNYLKIILNSIPNNDNVLKNFYEGQPINLIYRISNEKDYLKMFQVIYDNSNLHISKEKEFNSLPISILESISYYDDKDKQNIYSKFIINKFKLFESTFFDNLILFKSNDFESEKSLKTNFYLFYYFNNFGTDKILNFINNNLQKQLYNKNNDEKVNICFQFHNSFISSKNDLFSLSTHNITINTDLDFYSNFLNISILLSNIKKNNFNVTIEKPLLDYLHNFISFITLSENRSLNFILDNSLEINPSKIVNYLTLNSYTSDNLIKQKTLKI